MEGMPYASFTSFATKSLSFSSLSPSSIITPCQKRQKNILKSVSPRKLVIRASSASSSVVTLLDCGAGNVRSLRNAIHYLGFEIEDVQTPKDILNAEHLIFPGVGEFASAMDVLVKTEYECCILAGMLCKLQKTLKFWRMLEINMSTLFTLIVPFQYALPYDNKEWVSSTCNYGDDCIASIRRGNVHGVQFHPEKNFKIHKFLPVGMRMISDMQISVQNPTQGKASKLATRVIACLDVRTNDKGDLVATKGDQYDVSFLNITGFRDFPLGDLPMLQVLRHASENVFVPLTVGGGIRDFTDANGRYYSSLEVASEYFRSGADKISIGSDAVYAAEEYSKNKVCNFTTLKLVAYKRAVEILNGAVIDGRRITVGVARYNESRAWLEHNNKDLKKDVGPITEDISNSKEPDVVLRSLRDEKSYKDALLSNRRSGSVLEIKDMAADAQNRGKVGKNIMEMHISSESSSWVKRSLTGIIKHSFELELVQNALVNEGYDVQIVRWGYVWNSCVIVFKSAEEMSDAWMKKKEYLQFWFDRLEPLLNEDGGWGRVIDILDDTKQREDLTKARLLIRVASPFDVPDQITIGSHGRSFKFGAFMIENEGDRVWSENEEGSARSVEENRQRVDSWMEQGATIRLGGVGGDNRFPRISKMRSNINGKSDVQNGGSIKVGEFAGLGLRDSKMTVAGSEAQSEEDDREEVVRRSDSEIIEQDGFRAKDSELMVIEPTIDISGSKVNSRLYYKSDSSLSTKSRNQLDSLSVDAEFQGCDDVNDGSNSGDKSVVDRVVEGLQSMGDNHCFESGFSDLLEEALATWEISLIDLPLSGGRFTWCNNQDSPTYVRLDRFLVDNLFMAAFLDLTQSLLPRSLSDHNAVIIENGGVNWGKKPFKLFNYLMDEAGFEDSISSSIQERKRDKFPGAEISELELKIQKLEVEVQQQQDGTYDEKATELKELRSELWKLHKIEEHIWFQNSRSKWVEDGDRNTRLFHTCASVRRKKMR
ncbi:Imidazole glycerol phosphate synthase hisHF [Hibiscus syriacus]|uniref:Imidazole glycerol phosphate synthase hisHF n=1 Tax=Hibiscus syriacus TaxID=106335 RepID=A0A6A2X271_HIBSY|nr:Imidazole glycerol phosphate synthase hisHF [Hibiscus syriacus]